MWFRVFGAGNREPCVDILSTLLQPYAARAGLGKDELGWFSISAEREDGGQFFQVNRYLTKEEGIRAELNTWAAWLETQEAAPNHEKLMLDVIRTTQLFTMYVADSLLPEGALKDLCFQICRHLARETDGVYQVDGLGFFDREGKCLLEESADGPGPD